MYQVNQPILEQYVSNQDENVHFQQSVSLLKLVKKQEYIHREIDDILSRRVNSKHCHIVPFEKKSTSAGSF
jgi:hypothetical protein